MAHEQPVPAFQQHGVNDLVVRDGVGRVDFRRTQRQHERRDRHRFVEPEFASEHERRRGRPAEDGYPHDQGFAA